MAELNSGDTAWVLISAAIVLFMTPGLAFFYGGMVRAKNVLGMLMQNFFTMGMITLVWSVIGFSLAFGAGNGFWGGLDFFALQDLTASDGAYPYVAFVAFQMMFAVITPALITGAIADRMKFSAFAVFITLWSILVYSPIAHWVWASTGWLFERGALDFAGGTVVHANAGIAAIVLAVVLGNRRGWPGGDFRPHNVPFVLLGTGILWVGWFGFNAGSALGANKVAAFALLNTQIGAATAILGWIAIEYLRDGKATTLGAASGAVAGLVAITPACGFVSPMGSIAIGLIAGAVCALATSIKGKVGIDDSLDVGAVHLVGGVLGALLTGFFATVDTNPAGKDGVFYGGPWKVVLEQLIAIGATLGYSAVVTLLIALAIKYTIGLKVSEEEEEQGLDEALHGETAYRQTSLSSGSGFTSVAAARVPEEAQA
ncbi:ammonium transporter [Frankia sp. CcI49]|uniref:Ammonium transporter n=1 Tax=Parafrankia irregularis TaxID=795642 RepID=A0A0S4QGA8_9ACTN|nr:MULTISPECIES: ammonium transporter [Frankiaceae]KPM53324.1 ammonium transporter [Frankia sp. R43]MBE3203210.1 ammonium transporter [Parafrankia sp. CH37]ONH59637.1 ammonium transporter [Frankia sp. CcI49]CUU54146.1 ammonium transporter, Amt family [Parafrankia irregularis]